MYQILNIIQHDLKKYLRSPLLVIFLVVLPVLELAFFSRLFTNTELLQPGLVQMIILNPVQNTSNNGLKMITTGVLSQFILLSSVIAAGNFMSQREDKTLRRILTAPVTKAQFLIGQILSHLILLTLITLAIMSGCFIFLDIHWGNSLFSLSIVTLLNVFMATSFSLLIATLFKDSKAATGIMSAVVIIMAFLSGGMTGILPPSLEKWAPFTLNKWIMDSFKSQMNGTPLSKLYTQLVPLAGLGLLFMILAIIRFRKEEIYE